MPELTREEKLKLVEKLPQRLQDFLYSEDTGAFLLYIGQKYNLTSEEVSALSKIIVDVVLGITPLTLLTQEITAKAALDAQTVSSITQELNNELLTPAIRPVQVAPAPMPAAPRPAAPVSPAPPAPFVPVTPRTDQYREPTTGGPARQRPEPQALAGGPEVVDLRKTPPPPMQMPVAAAPIPPRPPMPTLPIAPKPLTFTKPVEPPVVSRVEPTKPMPLIEAEPHKVAMPPPPADLSRPQYIIRPPGLAPTDLPRDVLDLRKDKGEF